MYINGEVWPDVVNGFKTVLFNNFFDKQLNPGRHTNNNPDVPVVCFFSNFIQLCIPVAFFGYPSSGLIKMLKPEGEIISGNSTQIAFEITSFLVEVSASPEH